MNYNKSIALCLLLLTSNIMNAGIISKIIGTGIVLYVHQNVLTKQDLTKIPQITSEDLTEYYNKFSATIMNTQKSLQPIFKQMEESLKESAAAVELEKNKNSEEAEN